MARNFTTYPKTPTKLIVYGDTLCKYNPFSFVKDSDTTVDFAKSFLTHEDALDELENDNNLIKVIFSIFNILIQKNIALKKVVILS